MKNSQSEHEWFSLCSIRYLYIIFILFILLISINGLAQSTSKFLPSWTVTAKSLDASVLSEGTDFVLDEAPITWRIPERKFSTEHEILVKYSTRFFLESVPVDGIRIHLPPTWANYSVFLNDIRVTPRELDFQSRGNIFGSIEVDVVNKVLLPGDNRILIELRSLPALSGFRSDKVRITLEQRSTFLERLERGLGNDLHGVFAVLSILVSITASLFAVALKDTREAFGSLALAAIVLLPYNLLGTNAPSIIFNHTETLFRLHLSLQFVSWPCFIVYGIRISEKTPSAWIVKLFSLRNSFFLLGLGFILFFGTLNISFSSFQKITLVTFLLELCLIPLLLRTSMSNFFLFSSSIFASITALISIFSDIICANFYFVGHGAALLSVTGFTLALRRMLELSRRERALGAVVKTFLPKTVFKEIQGLASSGAPIEDIRQKVSGFSTLVNIFVDICDWGVMNERLPRSIVLSAREVAFERIGRIFDQFGIDMVKTTGDNLHFVCGLDRNNTKNDIDMSDRALGAIVSLLDGIDAFNAELRLLNLPAIRIKISATIGTCGFSLDGYSGNLRFDVQGHFVNIAKRYEDSMNAEFYNIFGRNVALVSKTIIVLTSSMTLRSRFKETFVVQDKHGQKYETFVCRQYPDSVKMEDFLSGLFGQFAHEKDEDKKAREIEKLPYPKVG